MIRRSLRAYSVDMSVNLQVESRDSVNDATPEAEMRSAMTSTPCAWRDSAHVRPDIHKSPASAVNYVYLCRSVLVTVKHNERKRKILFYFNFTLFSGRFNSFCFCL